MHRHLVYSWALAPEPLRAHDNTSSILALGQEKLIAMLESSEKRAGRLEEELRQVESSAEEAIAEALALESQAPQGPPIFDGVDAWTQTSPWEDLIDRELSTVKACHRREIQVLKKEAADAVVRATKLYKKKRRVRFAHDEQGGNGLQIEATLRQKVDSGERMIEELQKKIFACEAEMEKISADAEAAIEAGVSIKMPIACNFPLGV